MGNKTAVVVLVLLASLGLTATTAHASNCDTRIEAATHKAWVKDLRGGESIPGWAKRKHAEQLRCARSRAHGQAMRNRWRAMKRTILPPNHDLWVAIGRCEQPGSGYRGVNWSHPGPTFQGGLGFWHGTWDGYKPAGFPADAGQASWRQQMKVANILLGLYGTSPWGCA